ncbi:hypothetical protein NL676_039317 [Syzygium grande]|nr:hypothetical protein NL676_039317 [Syzygium grande]
MGDGISEMIIWGSWQRREMLNSRNGRPNTCCWEVWETGKDVNLSQGIIPRSFRYECIMILLFNCMDVRDPQLLLPRLVNICTSSGTHFSKALFVPSMSSYNKVTFGASVITLDIPTTRDLSWQYNLQRIWEKIIHGKDVSLDKSSKTDSVDLLAPS